MVRPWKLWSAATMTGLFLALCLRRTTLSAASLASVPELQKKTRVSACSRPCSRSARSTPGSWRNRLLVWAIFFTWSLTALTIAGCAWPSAETAMPAIRSR